MARTISAEEKRWRARDDLETLKRADEIKKNRTRLSAAKKEAKSQMDALNKVTTGRATKKQITRKPRKRTR